MHAHAGAPVLSRLTTAAAAGAEAEAAAAEAAEAAAETHARDHHSRSMTEAAWRAVASPDCPEALRSLQYLHAHRPQLGRIQAWQAQALVSALRTHGLPVASLSLSLLALWVQQGWPQQPRFRGEALIHHQTRCTHTQGPSDVPSFQLSIPSHPTTPHTPISLTSPQRERQRLATRPSLCPCCMKLPE